jgi:hypothetical protein
MAEQELFDPLDPLGPEYGKINQPIPDAKGLSAFEGDLIDMPKANIPTRNESFFPSIANIDNLNRPNREIKHNLVKTNAVNPSIPKKPIDINQFNKSTGQFIQSFFQANQDKNNYAKIYSYNAGPDGNAFYKRYAAYGQKKFDEVGFSPLRDNEANFNARTTRWDDFSRMMTHSFVPLFTRGFVSGPKSLAKMLKGDFTSGDLEDAKVYEEAAAIGNSSKGGIFGFANNTVMNFGYTAGIIGEAIAEEAIGALFAAPTGGTSLIATTANNLLKIPKLFKGLNSTKKGYDAVRKTLKLTESASGARNFWNAARSSEFLKSSVQALNPLENTMHAFRGFKQADNLTDMAILSKTAGGFYRDVRKINMALSEARLEAGMVENHVYNKLYNEAYIANNNEVPDNKELAEIEKQAKDASYETLLENTALIYVSNGITFHNITGPKGGIRNFIKSTTDDIYTIEAREGAKNFGKIGKVIYDRTAKKFALEKNNIKNLAKGWLKNPVYKSVGNTVGYFKANFTEGIQENLQETIAEANEKYFLDSYKSPTLQTMLYSRAAMRAINRDKLDYFSDSWKEQNPFTAKGFETFASGFFMGTLAGPLNSAVPFLSSNWNRMFNKEQYQKWKEAQTTVAQNLVSQLNEMDLGTFMSEEMQNLGAQDLVGTLRARENKKAGLDSEVESYITQVQKLKNTGTFGIFKEKLEGLKELTDDEFADAVNIDLEQVPKYRTRIDKSVARLDKIKNLYERVERKFPNPISNINDLDKNDPDYEEKKLLGNAWNLATRNMVFFNETYDNILERRAAIDAKFNSNPKFQKIDNKQRNLLFNPLVPEGQFSKDSGDMVEEIDILKKELALEKELGKNSNKIRGLEEKIKITTDYVEKFKNFDLFFNRTGYIEKYAEDIKKATGRDATSEEIMEYMDSDLGGSLDENSPTGQRIISELRDSYKNYLKTLGKQKGEDIFSEDLDLTFEALMDYYKLGHEKVNIAKYVELFNDSDAFLDIVRRNTDWMRVQNGRRVKYFEDLIRSEMDKVRANALLNALADKGLYMSLEDMENYMNNGIPPKEIFNNITKEIYRLGTEKYAEVYREYFQKNDDLKSDMNPKKTGIIDDAYQKQIDDLEAKQQEEIDKLEKKPTRRETGEIKSKDRNKTFSATEATNQLAINEYVELKINKDSEAIVLFKDAEGNIHMDDVDGELVDVRDIKDRFSEGKKYLIEMLPDPLEVERITNIYNARIEEVFKAYAADKDSMDLEIPYEEVTQESNLNTPDLVDFRNALYVAYQEEYVANLPAEQQEALLEDSELDQETFEKWYSLPENKKYFDEYNDENRPALSEKETVLTVNGTTVDTKNRTLEQLFEIRDTLADTLNRYNAEYILIDEELEPEYLKATKKIIDDLSLDLKNLNVIIAARQFAKYPEEIKDSVRSIQKLFKAQEKVERVVLTEDDEVTGLKKGQTAYRVNGKIHRRMTQAMHDVIDEKYEYKGQEDVDTVFNQTIGKNGLNPASAKEFVDRLRILAQDDKKLPGTNKLFFDKLQDELLLLPARTPEQIKLENQKSEILTKANNEKDDTKKQALYDQAVEIQNKIDGVTTAPVSDIEAKKADIERISKLPFIERIPALMKAGIIASDLTYNLGKRFPIILNINGNKVAFYRSSEGTGGKEKGAWTPMFGFGLDKGNPWLIKGDINTQVNVGYNNDLIKEYTDILNKTLNWDHELDKGQVKNHPFFKTLKLAASTEAFNKELYGVEDLGIINGESNVSEFIKSKLAALEGTTQPTTKDNFDIATKKNGIKDITDVFFAEKSYQDGRDAGDFFDLAKDYLESGKKPEFNEKIITRQAYDDLIGVLDPIKSKIEAGEMYVVGRDLVVYDSDIDLGNERRDRIAGEIDLILVDKEGIYVLDIKSGEASKFLNFNNLSRKQKIFSKRNEYTLQTAGYATMLERMIDRKIAGVAMLPIQRRSNKETNQVIEVKKPINPDLYEELNYKRDADGKLILSTEIDPKTGKPFNEKQFEITKKKYKYDFLAPLYRESVQEEIDKLFGKKEGKLAPGAKRTLSRRYNLFRDILNQISDEESKANIDKIRRIEKLINDAIEKDGITIPDDIANELAQKKQALRAYMGKEVIKSIIEKYKEELEISQKSIDSETKKLEQITTDVSFDDIDSDLVDSIANEQYSLDKNFAFYYDKHNAYKDEDSKNATENQKLAILVMKQSKLLSDTDIEDDFIEELSMADASELIHEGVKRIQYLKTESSDAATNKFKSYQSKIFSLMTNYGKVLRAKNTISLFEDAQLDAENGVLKSAYDKLARKIRSLEMQLNTADTKGKITNIENQIDDFNSFREALALAYEIPFDAFENIVEGEVIVDEYDNEIKKGDEVYSRFSFDDTVYTVKEVTSKNIILEDEKGKEIKVEIGKFDEQYITESEMNAGETTPPGYNPTEGEKSIIEQSQMSVDDFLRNADEDKAKAHQEGTSNTPAQNRKNLLDKTKDCQ